MFSCLLRKSAVSDLVYMYFVNNRSNYYTNKILWNLLYVDKYCCKTKITCLSIYLTLHQHGLKWRRRYVAFLTSWHIILCCVVPKLRCGHIYATLLRSSYFMSLQRNKKITKKYFSFPNHEKNFFWSGRFYRVHRVWGNKKYFNFGPNWPQIYSK